jgi:hypothetical protein
VRVAASPHNHKRVMIDIGQGSVLTDAEFAAEKAKLLGD